MKEQIERKRRYKLHGSIISAGWPSISAFARDVGYSKSYLYMVLNGSLFPPGTLQRKFCETLGLTIKELGELL